LGSPTQVLEKVGGRDIDGATTTEPKSHANYAFSSDLIAGDDTRA